MIRETYPSTCPYGIPDVAAQAVAVPARLVTWANRAERRGNPGVHFFTDDYRFEGVWTAPIRYLPALLGRVVLGVDFSVYLDHPRAMQIWNTYRSRWLDRWMQLAGVTLIPAVGWAGPESYGFAFAGLPHGGQVAITSIGSRRAQGFDAGYRAMVERLAPTEVVVVGPRLPAALESLAEITYREHDQIAGMRRRAAPVVEARSRSTSAASLQSHQESRQRA